MKLTIKTLQSSTFKVDIEPDKTVKDLKELIEREQGKDYPRDAQKLIYSGKILTDEDKLSVYKFDEKKFIVLMITRPPPVSKQQQQSEQTSTSTSSTSALVSTASNPAKSESTEDNKTKKTVRTSSDSNPASTATATTTSSTPRTTNRTPTNTSTPATAEQRRQHESRSSALSNEASMLAMGEPQVASRVASMMAQPQFRQMQELIQQSPHLLSSMIESLAASDPEMYNFISENPDVFVNALNHPSIANRTQPSGGGSHHDMMSQQQLMTAAALAASANLNSGGQQPRVVDQLHGVSEHDKEAIERLKELGFSEYLAVQAYMACDKDEQLAADLLFRMD